MENQEQSQKNVRMTKAQRQAQVDMQKKAIQRDKEQMTQMEARRKYLQCLVDIRDLEEKAYGQDALIQSVKRDTSIYALRHVKTSEIDILEYLVNTKLATSEDQKIYAELKKVQPEQNKLVMKISKKDSKKEDITLQEIKEESNNG